MDRFTLCDCDSLCQSISITSRASGIRSLQFSAPKIKQGEVNGTAAAAAATYLACGTGDGHLICWHTRIFLETKTDSLHSQTQTNKFPLQSPSVTPCVTPCATPCATPGDVPCSVFVVGTSPVQHIEWSNADGFIAISGNRGLVVLPRDSLQPQASRVHASVLQSHRAMCHIFTGKSSQCAATATTNQPEDKDAESVAEESSVSLFAVVTSEGGLALVELDSNQCMRWSRHSMDGTPRHVAFHHATDTVVVSATLANGSEVLRVHNAEDLQLLREINMRPDQHICVVSTLFLNGRELIVLVASVDDASSRSSVAGRDVDHVNSNSTLSLIIPVRQSTRGIALSVAHTMVFEGRSAAVCAFETQSLALAVDNRVLLLRVDPHNVSQLMVVAGLASPKGGAILCLSRVQLPKDKEDGDEDKQHSDALLVGEMSASCAMYVLDEHGRQLVFAGQDATLQQGGVCRQLCGQEDTGKSALFCDWATNTLHALDTQRNALASKEICRLESHAVEIFNGSLLPRSVDDVDVGVGGEFLVVARDGSIVQLTM